MTRLWGRFTIQRYRLVLFFSIVAMWKAPYSDVHHSYISMIVFSGESWDINWIFETPETNSSHLPEGRDPKGKACLPSIYFQVPTVSFRDVTLPETNISPENRSLEKEILIGNHMKPLFLGAFAVSFREGSFR